MNETREHTCPCGQAFTQQTVGTRSTTRWWYPAVCPACQIRIDADALTQQAQADRAEREATRLSRLRVPQGYRNATLSTFELHGTAEERLHLGGALAYAHEYVTEWPAVSPFVVFQGAYQTGKTHLAWAILRALAERYDVYGQLATLADIVRDLREPWRASTGPSEAVRLSRWRSLPLLVVDELSEHGLTAKNVQPHLYDIIAYRINERRPTVVTTNEPDEGIIALLGPALTRRLELAGGVVDFGARGWVGK